MAENGGHFKPGHPGGPGRPPLPSDVKEARQMTQSEIELALNKFLLMTPEQLKKAKQDPETMMLDHLIISIMTHGVNKGCDKRADFLMNRLVGKVKQQIEHSGEISNPYMHKTREELEALVKERLEKK
jgi:hypothetical protein